MAAQAETRERSVLMAVELTGSPRMRPTRDHSWFEELPAAFRGRVPGPLHRETHYRAGFELLV